MNRGLFVAIEGAEATGKSTVSRLLHDLLSAAGWRIELHREPTDGPIGQLIRRALRGELSFDSATMRLLFAADRHEHCRALRALLSIGTTIVCDRYDLSNLAYQWAQKPEPEAMLWAASLSRGCLIPDMTIVLQAPLEACLERLRARGGKAEIYDAADFQRRVHEAYGFAHSLVKRHVEYLDASGPAADVAAGALALVERHVADEEALGRAVGGIDHG